MFWFRLRHIQWWSLITTQQSNALATISIKLHPCHRSNNKQWAGDRDTWTHTVNCWKDDMETKWAPDTHRSAWLKMKKDQKDPCKIRLSFFPQNCSEYQADTWVEVDSIIAFGSHFKQQLTASTRTRTYRHNSLSVRWKIPNGCLIMLW